MKSLFLILSMLFTFSLFAQNTVSWLGGTPGKETDWSEAKNWSNHKVPDEFSNVIISPRNSGHQALPTIQGDAEALSIEIHSGASLLISKDALLTIDGEGAFTRGIQVLGGSFVNNGNVDLRFIDQDIVVSLAHQCKGKGMIKNDAEIIRCQGTLADD